MRTRRPHLWCALAIAQRNHHLPRRLRQPIGFLAIAITLAKAAALAAFFVALVVPFTLIA